jgi:hypothetical protein
VAFRYRFLFVGVNKGIGKGTELQAAERDAEELARAFGDLGLGGWEPEGAEWVGEVETLVGEVATAPKVHRALRAIRECERCDLLLVFWAGHFMENNQSLVTTDTETGDEPGRVRLTDLSEAILLNSATNRVLLLDVCYAGKIIREFLAADMHKQWDEIEDRRKDETLYVLAAADSTSPSYENGRLGPLAALLIPALRELKPDRGGGVELGVHLKLVYQGLQKPDALNLGDMSIPIMVRRSVRPQPPGGREPLEQAMAYAVQAFRDYLNAWVVKNVEVIYFLAYDVWDGCLVYDGLVHGSVEHRLLEYIRRQFLEGDRLRSRFEELRVDYAPNKGYPRTREPGDPTPRLGAAGQCFADALNYIREHPDDDPVQKLWYVGDLNYYESEYRAYDRLLGLGSCLYIPIVGRLVHGSLREDHERPPLGGILMAGSREPYGLQPVKPQLNDLWRAAQGFAESIKPYESGISVEDRKSRLSQINDRDIRLASAIVQLLPGLKDTDAGESGHRAPTEIENFLQCIGGVYAQRAKQRSRLRRLIHPQAVKGVARGLERSDERESRATKIEEIAINAERERAEEKINKDPLRWREYLDRNKVGLIRPKSDRSNGADTLTWRYVTALAWRDLRLAAQNTASSVAEAAAADAAFEALKQPAPEPGLQEGPSWDFYIEDRAEGSDRIVTDDLAYEMKARDSTVFHLRQVRRLIDDLRDLRDDPFTLLLQQLRILAPIDAYMEGIEEVEAVLASSEREEYLRHLAHTVQVWMLGVWILEGCVAGSEVREMDRAVTHIRRFFDDLASRKSHNVPVRAGDWFSSERLALFWGLVAAMHDLAEPVQRFAEWSQRFLERYFGGWSIQIDLRTPVLLDVLHHTRYPFYKNAITSLYGDRERNWLESVFYAELVKWMGHPISGSLILVHEMEKCALDRGPENGTGPSTARPQPQMWRRISELLRPMLQRPDGSEQGLLLPAYLAHGITFSHLGEIKEHWQEQYSRSKEEPNYLLDVTARFHVDFENYPLTYLMGLCEILLEPTQPQPVRTLITFDGPDPYTGLSPFFVTDVRMESSQSGDSDPTIVITIALWLDGLQRETRASFELEDIKQLWANFGDRDPMPWKVLNYEAYHTSWAEVSQQGGLHISNNTSWLKERIGPLYVARPAYEIIRMQQKLEEFKGHYRSKRGVEVRFKNVDDGGYGVVLAPSPA